MMFISVDLPDPEAPMTDTISPASISRSTDFSTWTRLRPVTYVLSTCSRWIIPVRILGPWPAADHGGAGLGRVNDTAERGFQAIGPPPRAAVVGPRGQVYTPRHRTRDAPCARSRP